MHGPRCQLMRADLEFFECAALPPNTLAPKRARHLVGLVIDAWNLPELADAATEAASELVTNALRYGRLVVRIDLRVYVQHGQLVFEVEDRSPQRPIPKPLTAARRTGSGFGLQIIGDTADDWGFEYFAPDHKRVWAAWDLPARPQDPGDPRNRSTHMSTNPPTAMYPGDRRAWTLTGEPGCSPTLADVRAWVRGTITGPWCLPDEVAAEADRALTGMMPDQIRPDNPLSVRMVRVLAGLSSVVTVCVNEERVQLQPSPSRQLAAALTGH